MRKSRFTESQIVSILKQGEAGVPIAEILRQHNISKATYFHLNRTRFLWTPV
jgi:putative transposase